MLGSAAVPVLYGNDNERAVALLGSALVLAVPFSSDPQLDYAKLGVKLVIAVGIAVLFAVEGIRARPVDR